MRGRDRGVIRGDSNRIQDSAGVVAITIVGTNTGVVTATAVGVALIRVTFVRRAVVVVGTPIRCTNVAACPTPGDVIMVAAEILRIADIGVANVVNRASIRIA